ncbi:MAG: hypothetical protein JO047_00700, partial [Alphaproteobacteria bacterium]|nr:hypothetical protein [Alphaproteobacteria bacterium]
GEVAWPAWPSSLTGPPAATPRPPGCVAHLSIAELDFQRLSFQQDRLVGHQARDVRKWLNLEIAGEQQRQFLIRLPPGRYRAEFRLLAEPMFGRRYAVARLISLPLFPLSRVSQWIATAAFAVEEPVAPVPE